MRILSLDYCKKNPQAKLRDFRFILKVINIRLH